MTRNERRTNRHQNTGHCEDAANSVNHGSAWWAIALPSIASSILLWAAFAPLALGWLGWFAPIGWLLVIQRAQALKWSDYKLLWFSGCLFWLPTLQGIRLAFWPLTFGWLALSLYLAVYIPLFVLVSRVLIVRWRFPIVIAAPTSWVGFELVRGYFVTGFSANLLAHTQINYPVVIQLADQLGGYGISFLVMMVAVGILHGLQRWRKTSPQATAWQPMLATVALLLALSYGIARLRETDGLAAARQPLLKVALIQENAPSVFESNPQRARLAWSKYLDATRSARQEFGALDLVIWPESTFSSPDPLILNDSRGELPQEFVLEKRTLDDFRTLISDYAQVFTNKSAYVLMAASGVSPADASPASNLKYPHLLVGCNTMVFTNERSRSYNSAVLIGPNNRIVDRYDKVHLVMFGEYIPLGPLLSFIERVFNFSGANAGTDAKCFEVDGVRLVPCICFESVLPHFISWQMQTLKQQSLSPDILVNITNDSWFRGSSILDHHLACAILATIEHRRPMLVAANGGLSAWIDGAGRVQAVSPRLKKHLILATPYRDNRWGLFQVLGDAPAWLAASLCVAALGFTAISTRRNHHSSKPDSISTESAV